MQIQLSKIKPAPKPIRKSWDEDKMVELAASIKARGLIVPPKLRPNGSDYEVVYGHRRLEAARRAGLKSIECIVEGVDDKNALAQSWIENRIREDMTAYDIADALVELAKQEGVDTAAALARLGYGRETTLARYWTLQSQPPVVRKIMDQNRRGPGRVSVQSVETISGAGLSEKITAPGRGAHIAKLTNEGVAVLRKAASEQLSEPQVRRVAEAIVAARTPERKKQLLETPYSTLLHDADVVREMPARPDKTFKRERQERQELTAKVKSLLTKLDECFEDFLDAKKSGKFSPEAVPFVSTKVRKFLKNWEA